MIRPPAQLKNDALVWASRATNTSLAPPDWVTLNVTLRCNLHCTMCTTCYESPELSHRALLDLIDQVANWGVKVLNLLGGEPFVREDIVEVLEYAARRDLYVTVTTNGTLITPEAARRLAEIAYNRLHFNISIDGFESVHDHIRGKGMLSRTLEGFRLLREADEKAGQAPRKILVNSVVNNKSLDDLPDFVRWIKSLGFSGIQLLNLFKHGGEVSREIKHLWIGFERWNRLDEMVEAIKDLKNTIDPVEFEIVNSTHQLDIMKLYYREQLPPRLAPCFAGWKELYINADGKGIMCDGKLDFINGQFGNIHHMTLLQMWEGEELKARRSVVKACTSPCIQDCYLRENSDNMFKIVRGVGRVVVEEVKKWREKPGAFVDLPGTELTLELSDVSDLAASWELGKGGSRFPQMVASCPVPFDRVYEDPRRFFELRNTGALSFNRGFMGFELIRKVIPELKRGGVHFSTLRLAWRGEPLLHPEFGIVLPYVLDAIRQGIFSTLRIDTHGALLCADYVEKALASGVPHSWVVSVDAADGATYQHIRGQDQLEAVERNLKQLLEIRKAFPAGRGRLVVAFTCLPENVGQVGAFVDRWRHHFAAAGAQQPQVVAGEFPTEGDTLWIRRQDCKSFLPQLEARRRLEQAAAALGLPPPISDRDGGGGPRCAAPFKTPTISWDGKVTLCPWDRTLQLRAGEITVEDLTDIWLKKEGPADARRAVKHGTLHQRSPCRDCVFPFSPNAPVLTDEDLTRWG